MKPRDELAKIVREETPMRIMGATISFLRMQGRTNFERHLAVKLDELIVAEIREAQKRDATLAGQREGQT